MNKHYSIDRFDQGIAVPKRETEQERSSKMAQLLHSLEALVKQPAQQAPPHSVKIAIKTKGRVVFVMSSDLVSAKAEGNYVLLQQRNGTHLLREQISVLAQKLQPYGFMRIHRSVLINPAYVEAMKPMTNGEYSVCMKNGVEFNVARTYRRQVKELGVLWLGTEQGLEH
jgi:two-component system LytT family response regulator